MHSSYVWKMIRQRSAPVLLIILLLLFVLGYSIYEADTSSAVEVHSPASDCTPSRAISETEHSSTTTAGLEDAKKRKFAKAMASETGMSLRVITTWVQSEGGNSLQNNNWLNIGHAESDPRGVASAPEWSDPQTAGIASGKWLQGEWGKEYDYVASRSIQDIIKYKNKSNQEQIKAIAGSGWATSDTYLELLRSLYK